MGYATSWHSETVAAIELDYGPVNALSYELIDGFRDGLRACVDARVVIVSSALQRFFAAGADLTLLSTLDKAGFERYLRTLKELLQELSDGPFISIAAIDGLALGGGFELALACTFRVTSSAAHLGLPEVGLGLLPGAGGTQRLTRLLGRARALDLLLSGRRVDGQEALDSGLAERLAGGEPTAAKLLATEWAAQLAAVPPSTAAAIMRCVDAASGDPAVGDRVESDEVIALFDSPIGREGVVAFSERRPPHFDSLPA